MHLNTVSNQTKMLSCLNQEYSQNINYKKIVKNKNS